MAKPWETRNPETVKKAAPTPDAGVKPWEVKNPLAHSVQMPFEESPETAKMPLGRKLIHSLPVAGMVAGGLTGRLTGPASKFASPALAILGGGAGNVAATALDKYFYPEETKDQPFDPYDAYYKGSLMSAVGETIGAAPEATKYGLSVFGGPKKQAIDTYLAQPKRVNSAPTMTQIKDRVDSAVEQLRMKVQNGQMSVDEAKLAMRDLNKEISSAGLEYGRQYGQEKFMANKSLTDAESKLETAHDARIAGLQDVPKPIAIADDVQASIGDLKKQVVKGSADAYKHLDGAEVSTKGLADIVQKQIDELHVTGFNHGEGQYEIKTKSSAQSGRSALEKLEAFKKRLEELPETIYGKDAKAEIQRLDNDVTYLKKPGEFSPEYDNTVKEVRRQIDKQIKFDSEGNATAYNEAMAPVREKTALLEKANDTFGDRQTTVNKLSTIHTDLNEEARQTLEQLGAHTNREHMSYGITDYQNAQAALKNPEMREAIRANIPEAEPFNQQNTQFQEKFGQPNSQYDYVQNLLKERKDKLASMSADAQARSADLEKSQGELEPFKNITPQNSEGKILEYMRAKSPQQKIETQRQFGSLSPYIEKDELGRPIQEQMADRQVMNEFEKGNINGSRNVQLLGKLGGMLGGLAGLFSPAAKEFTVPLGVGLGGLAGGVADNYGPQLTKGALDAYLKPYVKYPVDTAVQGARYGVPYYLLKPEDNQ